jgi:hypothetical protein
VAKKGRHNYIVPYGSEVADTDDFICVSLYCPAEWFAVASLLGSYASLGKSAMWSQDANGQAMAEKFLKAYHLSFKDEFMCKILNEITVNCGCSTCSGGTTNNITINPNSSVESPPADDSKNYSSGASNGGTVAHLPAEVQAVYPTAELYDAELCRTANYVVGQWFKSRELISAIIDSTTEYSVGLIATALALAIFDGPLPFGDMLGVTLLLAPAVRLFIKDRGISGENFTDLWGGLDRCEMVQAVYSAGTESGMADALTAYCHSVVDSSGLGELAKSLGHAYVNYTLDTKFSKFTFDTLLANTAQDVDNPCICSDDTNDGEWLFTTDEEGWFQHPSQINSTFSYNPSATWTDNQAYNGGLRMGVINWGSGGTPAEPYLRGCMVNIPEYKNLVLSSSPVVTLNMSNHWTSHLDNWQDVRMEINFWDGTNEIQFLSGGDATRKTLNYSLDPLHAGKKIKSIEFSLDSNGLSNHFYTQSAPYTYIYRVSVTVD